MYYDIFLDLCNQKGVKPGRVSRETGVPCFVAYYRRYLPYFQKVRELLPQIGNVLNVQIRFAVPPRDLDYNRENLPWRVIPDIAGGGYFYDLAPHQIDLLQDMFGISEAEAGPQATFWINIAKYISVLACAVIADRWYLSNKNARAYVPGIAFCVAGPCVLLAMIFGVEIGLAAVLALRICEDAIPHKSYKRTCIGACA